jgi:predicted nucleic acid-binding protein
MRYVLDTNVVSALRLHGRHARVEAWAAGVEVSDQFVTVMTVAEIERGVVAEERSDAPQGKVLRRWFDGRVLPAFAGRVLPFDLPAARILATYRVPEHSPLDHALVAAIAQAAGMTVATRNFKRFEPLGVPASTRGITTDRSPELPDRSPELPDRSPELPDRSPEVRDRSPELPDRWRGVQGRGQSASAGTTQSSTS